jgi:hypothetical protein
MTGGISIGDSNFGIVVGSSVPPGTWARTTDMLVPGSRPIR